MAPPRAPLRVAVAGATGFIGRALVQRLGQTHEVIGLTRRQSPSGGKPPGTPGLRWRSCDLFSALDAERALEGVQVGIYLIHSMRPSARLTQASFQDLDLILADNFRRAAERMGLSQIVYMGELLPEGTPLSPHLRSRLEVERTLGAGKVPVTALRAGPILGPGGPPFLVLERLVERSPVMLLPRWTRTPTQPISLEDVLALIDACLGTPDVLGRTCELGGPDVVTWRELFEATARALGVRRRFFDAPALPPRLSSLWVSRAARAPIEWVGQWMRSARYPLLAKDRWLQERLGRPGLPVEEALRRSVTGPGQSASGRGDLRDMAVPVGDVRSVQRMPLPAGWSARDVAREYARWVPRFMAPFIHVEVDAGNDVRFFLRPLRRALLELTWSASRSTPDRQLFYITGGLLARQVPGGRARLEFREVLDRQAVLAAVHDFTPRLPWLVYKSSQALVHLQVMSGFRRHLERLARAGAAPGGPEPAGRRR